jgi:hypothetical protein
VPTKRIRAMAMEALKARADAKAADLAPIIKELQAAGKTSLSSLAYYRQPPGNSSSKGSWPPGARPRATSLTISTISRKISPRSLAELSLSRY